MLVATFSCLWTRECVKSLFANSQAPNFLLQKIIHNLETRRNGQVLILHRDPCVKVTNMTEMLFTSVVISIETLIRG